VKIEKVFQVFGLKAPNDKAPSQVDVIVGVGAGLGSLKTSQCTIYQPNYSPQTEAVVVKATSLFVTRGKKEKLFFSGGFSLKSSGSFLSDIAKSRTSNIVDPQIINTTESQVMRLLARDIIEHRTGVPLATEIAIEIKSRNNLENVGETIRFLQENGYNSAIVVDFWAHLGLIKRVFLKQVADTEIKLYFINANAKFGGNVQPLLNHPWLFLFYEIAVIIYYKFVRAI